VNRPGAVRGIDASGRRRRLIPRIAVFKPLAVSAGVVVCTILIHTLAVVAVTNLVRLEKKLGRVGKSLWMDAFIVFRVIAIALVAHLIEIAVWAELFVMCGEFTVFGTAYYHSAMNYTTLGYGDVVMTASWRLLGPLEAANGMLLFGVTTAMVFTVILRLAESRLADLRE
jgi:voltage-gated potassium channel Kch